MRSESCPKFATVEQLLVLANIEGTNAELIHMGLTQGERLMRVNQIAIRQMRVLTAASAVKPGRAVRTATRIS